MTPLKGAVQTSVRNILFTTDFSVASTRAFPYALALARQNNAIMHVVHVISPPARNLNPEAAIIGDEEDFETSDTARQNLNAFLPSDQIAGVRCHSALRQGLLWECISKAIDEWKIDLVVVGTKGSGGLTRLALGSGAEQIFREAQCPVMTIGPRVRTNLPVEFRRIFFAMDFTETSMQAYPYATAFARQNHCLLNVLHVVVPATAAELESTGISEHKQYIHSAVRKELAKHDDCEQDVVVQDVTVRYGTPATMILQYADHFAADLLIMGIRHSSRLTTHLPWTLAHEIVSEASCPVLTIRT